tara:strand:+ start:276 stop:1943 length:1668 start_codon:yes stop_codon:yes gene_type:complete
VKIKFDEIPDALAAIRNGECVVVVDDERRENEGDLICAAQFATPEQINFMAREARGLICLAMQGERLDKLDLPLMVDRNTDSNQTAFTVSIDAGPEHGVSTGISAEDRAKTIQVALRNTTKSIDLRRPGHIFPLRARKGGVLKRAGHTEAAVDLASLSGLSPAGVICEIQNSDGSMARLPELDIYSKNWNLKLISIADLIRYRLENERFVTRKALAKLPSIFGGFNAIGYKNELDGSEHVALVKGNPESLKEPVLVRMHSECLTGDAFGSLRCDCRPQLEAALSRIELEGEGVVVYLRQEGRGIGLINKLMAYNLQDGGLDTVEANEKLGFPADLRNYGVGAQILTDLGIHKLKLLTNNPRKIAGLGGYGLQVVNRIPLIINPSNHNADYLAVKRDKLGHLLDQKSKLINNKFTDNFTVLSLHGSINKDLILRLNVEIKSFFNQNEYDIIETNSSRIFALLEKPSIAWILNNTYKKEDSEDKYNTLIIDIFVKFSLYKYIECLSLLRTESLEKALHPSLNLEVENYSMNELELKNEDLIEKISDRNKSFIINWKK